MNTARTRFGLAVSGIAAMIAGGCSPQPAAEHQPAAVAECATPGIEAGVAGVDRCSAESVLHAAITTIFSYRPHEEADQQVAFRSARELTTPSFAHQAQPAALVWAPVTTQQWQHWRDEGIAITTAVRLTCDDHPPDTATSANRVLSVRLQPGDEPFVVFAVYARATRASTTASWLLAGLEVTA
ncbi:hypothetical protein ACIBCD_33900 [Nocardia brasiliensis]|uniref:hypothetical protein n=1 Tax=Nocardia brasiliensis TaxID=37326 RepID=UPI0037A58FD6